MEVLIVSAREPMLFDIQRLGSSWSQAASLDGLAAGICHGFSARVSGADSETFAGALRGELNGMGVPANVQVHTVAQVHSPDIVDVRAARPANAAAIAQAAPLGTADGLILGPGAEGILAIQVADCVPVLAVQTETGACAALHAGWRGTAAGILPRLLERWGKAGGIESVRIAIGPSIRGCCYEVRDDCLGAFAAGDLGDAVERRDGASYLDLTRVLRNQARRFGVESGSIEVLDDCTYCTEMNGSARYASFRRDGHPGKPYPQRNAAFIGRWRGRE